MATVSFSEATKIFRGGTVALDRLTLEIRDGEFMVLVGPSGCGKTTALRLLAGLEHVTAGEVRIADRVVNDLHPRERDIAMVFQNYALYPHMTVRRNIAFSLKVRKLDRAEIDRRVEDAARILGLSELLERKPAQLSGGQRQRVAMGRAIVRHPQAFLMDEPLSNLDAKLRVQMRGEITRIQHELGATTVYVTHDQVEAMTMGDRVAVLRRGRLQQVAPPQELFERPLNLFVASFIGSPEMNLVQATLVRNGDGFACRIGDQELAIPAQVTTSRPALAGYVGRTIGVGVRPEHLDDAVLLSDAGACTTLRGVVTATELLGSELLAHVEVQAPPVVTQEVLEVAGDVDTARVHELEAEALGSRCVLVGRFDTASRVRAGDPVAVAVDTAKLHFFDLETELAIPVAAPATGTA